jgi:hypothetical protein
MDMPLGPGQLASMGTATGKRVAFLFSTFVPSGFVARLLMRTIDLFESGLSSFQFKFQD